MQRGPGNDHRVEDLCNDESYLGLFKLHSALPGNPISFLSVTSHLIVVRDFDPKVYCGP